MTVEFRYARYGEYPRISRFLDECWAKSQIYVRTPQLFEWTFDRNTLWDREGYSFALAEDKDEVVGILGGIPFVFNCLGRASPAIWLVNYRVRPDYRRGPIAIRLLNMFRRRPYDAVVAFWISSMIIPFYRLLRWQVLEDIPRHFALLPDAGKRMVNLLRVAYPDWQPDRAEGLAHFFRLAKLHRSSRHDVKQLPQSWDQHDWPAIAFKTVGAVRDLDYLKWRYVEHPCFDYRFIIIPEGSRTGLAIWRLETIRCTTPQGIEEVDQIGRLLEFLPASLNNAKDLLSRFWQELADTDAMGADFYGYHGEISSWLKEFGFRATGDHPDGHAIPSRFQPLDGRGGRIMSAMSIQHEVPYCSNGPDCIWYWTKSDADQDRPN